MALNINGTTGISGVDGSASAPALQGTDSNTGVSFGSDIIDLNTGGSSRFKIGAAGQLGIAGANYGTSGQALLSQGASAAPQWGSVAVSVGGSSNISFNSGNGIDFSATADSAATKVGELLDDYEEGTWTPDLQISGSASGWSYYYRKGHYVKIGGFVHIGCHFYLSASPGGSGAVRLHGLPYQCDQSGFAWSVPNARRGGGAFGGTTLNVYVLDGQTSFPLVYWSHGSYTSGGYNVTQSTIVGSHLPTYTEVDISLSYFTAS